MSKHKQTQEIQIPAYRDYTIDILNRAQMDGPFGDFLIAHARKQSEAAANTIPNQEKTIAEAVSAHSHRRDSRLGGIATFLTRGK